MFKAIRGERLDGDTEGTRRIRYSTMQHNTEKHSTARYSTVQHSTTQYLLLEVGEGLRGQGGAHATDIAKQSAPTFLYSSNIGRGKLVSECV